EKRIPTKARRGGGWNRAAGRMRGAAAPARLLKKQRQRGPSFLIGPTPASNAQIRQGADRLSPPTRRELSRDGPGLATTPAAAGARSDFTKNAAACLRFGFRHWNGLTRPASPCSAAVPGVA